MPFELLEHDLCERFGWTLAELDEQDMARVLPMVQAANLRDLLRKVESWFTTLGKMTVTPQEWKLWNEVQELARGDGS